MQPTSSCTTIQNMLNARTKKRLAEVVRGGWTLLEDWPRDTAPVVQRWLGKRFFWSTSSELSPHRQYGCVVSSQLGRGWQRLEQWPLLLDWTLQLLKRNRFSLLAVPGTTLSEPAKHFALAAGIPVVELVLPKQASGDTSQIELWLEERMKEASNENSEQPPWPKIYLSPEWRTNPASCHLEEFPLRDRAAMVLADRVLALSVRPNGNIAGLLENRLDDSEMPPGSVFVPVQSASRKDAIADSTSANHWMSKGAVGWLIPATSADGLKEWAICQGRGTYAPRTASLLAGSALPKQLRSETTVVQVCSPASSHWTNSQEEWSYLTHCTRGIAGGRLPQESDAAYYHRLWDMGRTAPPHPIATLIRILRQRRLRGSTWLTRGHHPTVSLTSVPLKKLLARRHFQSHLGRWDWEPYGLMFRRSSIPDARTVIYGTESDFKQLTPNDQVYFQPVDSKYDWCQEFEWRVVGDVDLRLFAPEEIIVFVHRRTEAIQLSRESPFPVIWTEGIFS